MAQIESITQFEYKLAQETDIQQKIKKINQFVAQMRQQFPTQMMKLARRGQQLAIDPKSNEPLFIEEWITSTNLIALIYLRTGRYHACIKTAEKALNKAEQLTDEQHVAKTLNLIGYGYVRLGEYTKAYLTLGQALTIAQRCEHEHTITSCKITVAILLSEIGDHEQALHELKKVLDTARRLRLTYEIGLVLNNIAYVHMRLGAFDQALAVGREAYQFAEKHNIEGILHFVGSIIGIALCEVGDIEEASHYVNLHYDRLIERNDQKGIIFANQAQAQIALHNRLWNDAIAFAQQALNSAQEIGAKDDAFETHELLAKIYASKGEFDKAYDHLKQYHIIKQSLINDSTNQQLQILKIVHQTDRVTKEANQFRLKSDALETRVKERTQSLEMRTAELKQSLAREKSLANKLQVALEREERLSQLKTQIIETVSHEFRTPLTVMNTSTELLSYYNDRLSEEKRTKHLGHIQESVRYLTELLNETIFIGQLSQEPLSPTLYSYRESEFCQLLFEQIKRKYGHREDLELVWVGDDSETAVSQSITTDLELIQRALTNLLTNAIKYREDGSNIKIVIQPTETLLEIQVIDHGIGIPPEEQAHIFDLFYRAQNARYERGIGFGLHIVHQICLALHGELAVQSEGEGMGSTFTMRLPR